jgi:hypothetical protein
MEKETRERLERANESLDKSYIDLRIAISDLRDEAVADDLRNILINIDKAKQELEKILVTKKCRCYINSKFYARQANKCGNMKGYIPCPIHEIPELKLEDVITSTVEMFRFTTDEKSVVFTSANH